MKRPSESLGLLLLLLAGCTETSAPAGTTADGGAGESSVGIDSAPVDALIESDVALGPDTGVASDATADADGGTPSGCALPDVWFPPTDALNAVTQMLPFAGYMWIASYEGITRVKLPEGTTTKISGYSAYAEMHPHGTRLVVVNGSEVSELDPATPTKVKLFNLTGDYTNYIPRTALDGDTLYVLRNAPEGTELGRIGLVDRTWTSLWKGTKASGLARAKERTFLTPSYDATYRLVTVPDPGSSMPVFDALGKGVSVLHVDDAALYFRWYKDGGNDIHRLDDGSATAVPLAGPPSGAFDQLASDGTRLVHVTLQHWPDRLVSHVYAGGKWTELPCVETYGAWADDVAIVGSYAYVAVRDTFAPRKPYVARLKLP